jgi:hypothetical protein
MVETSKSNAKGKETKRRVMANFVKNGLSLHAYCEQKPISRGSADHALLNGHKRSATQAVKQLRQTIISDSKAKPEQLNFQQQ